MVVVAIVGVLGGIAVLSLGHTSYGKGVVGLARKFVTEIEACRVRALSTGHWQRIDVYADRAIVLESRSTGMVTPTQWDEARTLDVPQVGRFWGAEPVTRAGGGQTPADGQGLPFTLLFRPDGSAVPATIYFATPGYPDQKAKMRVVVYRATGVSYLWEGW